MDPSTERKINRHRESEARWLQKIMFASGKAREAREKLAEATGEDLNPIVTLKNGTKLPLDAIEEMIGERVATLREKLGLRH